MNRSEKNVTKHKPCAFLNSTDHRIRMERMVLDDPGLLEVPGIDHKTRTAQIAQVAVRVLARVVLDGDVGEQGIGGPLVGRNHVFAQHAIGRQIVDD